MYKTIHQVFLAILISAVSLPTTHAFGPDPFKNLEDGVVMVGKVIAGGAAVGVIVYALYRAKHPKSPKVKDAVLLWIKEGKITGQDLADKGIVEKIEQYAKMKNKWDGVGGLKAVLEKSNANVNKRDRMEWEHDPFDL